MSAMTKGNIKASKLSPGQVQEIRRLYGEGGHSQGALSRQFGVSVVQIGRIVRGEVWQQLPRISGPVSEGELQASAERLLRLQEETEGRTKLQQVAQATIGKAQGMLEELAGETRIDPFAPGGVYGPKTTPALPPDPLDELGDA